MLQLIALLVYFVPLPLLSAEPLSWATLRVPFSALCFSSSWCLSEAAVPFSLARGEEPVGARAVHLSVNSACQ